MAKAKEKTEMSEKEQELVNEFIEPVGPHSHKVVNAPIKVKTVSGFADGTLLEHFGKLGYPVYWPKGEERAIPRWLYNRCVQSGGEFEPVDG